VKLLVDCVIFQKDSHGGIARLFREILPRICNLEPNLQLTLIVDGPLSQELPHHSQIRIRKTVPIKRNLRVKGIWRPLLFPFRRLASITWNLARGLWFGQGEGTIWHSTYYSTPGTWRGVQVVTVHDMIHELFPRFYADPLDEIARLRKRQCVERAATVICVSNTTRQDAIGFYNIDENKVHMIPNACSAVFRPLSPIVWDDLCHQEARILSRPFLLYIGNRECFKNFTGLIDVYSRWEERTRISLVVVGKAWSNEEQHLLLKLGISERVILLNGVDDETLCVLYNLASAFVLPSLYEGFGIPLLEAMACGCPVVASRIPSTLEVAGECPIYFDTSNPESLVAALDRALLEGKASQRIGLGLERVKRFSWDQTARQTLEIYRSLDKVMQNREEKHD